MLSSDDGSVGSILAIVDNRSRPKADHGHSTDPSLMCAKVMSLFSSPHVAVLTRQTSQHGVTHGQRMLSDTSGEKHYATCFVNL